MRVYLDNNATTAVAPEVAGALARALASGPLNPGSPHASGRAARAKFEEAHASVLDTLGLVGNYRVVFCASATEAANIALHGLSRSKHARKMVLSAVEHTAVALAAEAAGAVQFSRIHPDGRLDLDDFRACCNDAALAAIMFANNETGALHPIEEIAGLCRGWRLPLLVDCCQAPGKTDFFDSIARARPEMLLLAGHKLHAPVGIAALVVASSIPLRAIQSGGGQQHGLRPGTEPIALALAFAAALKLAKERFDGEAFHRKTTMLWNAIQTVAPHAQLTVPDPQRRLANTLHYRVPGLSAERQIVAFDLAGLECSSASACESGSAQPSKVMLAMGYSREQALEGVRLSLSRYTTDDDTAFACKILREVLTRLLQA